MKKIIIVGSGAAGMTAAIYASRANLEPLLIAGSLTGGLLTQTTDVENYPGFPDAIGGFELMYNFQKQAERFGTKITNDSVVSVTLQEGGKHKLQLSGGDSQECQALIIATGSSPRWLGLESENRLKNRGVSACATCDGAFYKDVPVVVIGGGDSAMEEAIFLTKFASKVIVIHRREKLRASKIMAQRALENPKIEFCWNSTVDEVLGKDEVEGITVKNVNNQELTTIECKGYFAALGHTPNTEVFKESGITFNKAGYIRLKHPSSYTNIDGVFAAGDCADNTYKQAITAAGMGCKAAIDAERWLEANNFH